MNGAGLRIAQVMAGAPAGGAELFFERLCVGAAARRRCGAAGASGGIRGGRRGWAAAGWHRWSCRFGGMLDVVTRRRIGRQLRGFEPGVVVAWMNRAARLTPAGPWTLVGRLGGYYDLGYYRRCDHLVGNTRALVGWIVGQGWPAERVHYLANFSADLGGRVAAERAGLGVPRGAGWCWRSGGCIATRLSTCWCGRWRGCPGAHLVIAGEGPERAALDALARPGGRR